MRVLTLCVAVLAPGLVGLVGCEMESEEELLQGDEEEEQQEAADDPASEPLYWRDPSAHMSDEEINEQIARETPYILNGNLHRDSASVEIYDSNGKSCSGTIVSSRHILTAAHCVMKQWNGNVLPPAGGVSKTLTYKWTKSDGTVATSTRSTRIYAHQSYNDGALARAKAEWDFGVVAITSLFDPPWLSEAANRRMLDTGTVSTGDTYKTIGYGPNKNDGTGAGVQRSQGTWTKVATVNSRMFTSTVGTPLCKGDSGGGLFEEVGPNWYLVGITSNGEVPQGSSCVTAGAETRFSRMRVEIKDWIQGIIRTTFDEPNFTCAKNGTSYRCW